MDEPSPRFTPFKASAEYLRFSRANRLYAQLRFPVGELQQTRLCAVDKEKMAARYLLIWGQSFSAEQYLKQASVTRWSEPLTQSTTDRPRCAWATNDPLYCAYHDQEWGVPEYDSRALWETLMLEGFQAGLSWITILRKREEFRKAFKNFDPAKVARFKEADIARLLQNPGIIRSRAKIEATIQGARIYLEMQSAGEDFSEWVWTMAGGKPIQGTGQLLASSPLSETISKALKKRGFKFVGPVIVYAWMQAVGIVNDHTPNCFRRNHLQR
jgi:DNA-3-methyladenine glycosylase I